jgi:hypothetical protein
LELQPLATDDFFRARLDTMIDMRHPLVVLATRMPWAQIEAWLVPAFAHRHRKGRLLEGADLFGPSWPWPVPASATRAGHACRSADGGAAVPQGCLQQER